MAYKDREEIVETIARLREERGVSQAELGELLGIDQSSVSKLESGERGLTAAELATIAEFFETSVEDLIRADDAEAVVLRNDGDGEEIKDVICSLDSFIDDYLYLAALAK